MTSPRTRCVQATAGRPYGRSFRAKNRKSTLFLEYLCQFNDINIRIKVTVEDVPWRLASAHSVFKIRAGDRPVKTDKTAFFFLTCCLRNRRGENKERHPLYLCYR